MTEKIGIIKLCEKIIFVILGFPIYFFIDIVPYIIFPIFYGLKIAFYFNIIIIPLCFYSNILHPIICVICKVLNFFFCTISIWIFNNILYPILCIIYNIFNFFIIRVPK